MRAQYWIFRGGRIKITDLDYVSEEVIEHAMIRATFFRGNWTSVSWSLFDRENLVLTFLYMDDTSISYYGKLAEDADVHIR